MEQYKHICDFHYCRNNQVCLFKNACAILKNNAYKVRLGEEDNSNIILCYQKEELKLNIIENQTGREIKEKLINIKLNEPHCQNPKCYSVANTRFNGVINLCFECLDMLRENRTNYELGVYFKSKEKILKLFTVIDEFSPPKREMIRCSNIYCGTLDRMTKHHLIPKPFRNRETVEKIPLCEDCHKKVHQLATNTELAKTYNTKQSVIELLSKDRKFIIERVLNVYENVMVA